MTRDPVRPRDRSRRRAWRRDVGLAIAVIVLAAGLRAASPDDLWDHAQPRTIAYAVDMVVNGRWILPFDAEGHPATKPPLAPWLAAPGVAAFGPASRIVHLIPSLLAVVVTVGTIWWAGRRWWPRAAADTGAVAVILWISSPLAGRTQLLVRPDMVLTAAMTVGWVIATVMVIDGTTAARVGRPSRGGSVRWGGYVVAAAAAGLAKGPAMLPLLLAAPAGAWLAARRTDPARGRRPAARLAMRLGGPGTVAAILLPLAVWWNAAAFVDLTAVVRDIAGGEVFDRVAGTMPETRDAGPIRWLTTAGHLPAYFVARHAPWSLLFVVAVALHLRPRLAVRPPRSGHAARIATTMAVALGLATVAVYCFSAGKRADYLAPVLPAACLVAAGWLTAGDRRWHVRAPWFVAVVGGGLLVAGAIHARRPSNGVPAAVGPRLAAAVDAARDASDRTGLPIITLGSAEPSLAARLGRVTEQDLGRHAAMVAAGEPHILVHAVSLEWTFVGRPRAEASHAAGGGASPSPSTLPSTSPSSSTASPDAAPAPFDLPAWLQADPRIARIEIINGPGRAQPSDSPQSDAIVDVWAVWTIQVMPKGRVFKQDSPEPR